LKILVLGDSYCPAAALAPAFTTLAGSHEVTLADVLDAPDWQPTSPSELALREYLGTPGQVIDQLHDHQVLVVQGAPVSDAVLDAAPSLRMIGVARGGPVNVDLPAATARGVPVVTSPGKNAVSVAELTLAFVTMLSRRIPEAMRHVDGGGSFGHDNYEGSQWLSHDVEGRTLGLVGFGQVGRQVAARARALGMHVVAFDPYLDRGVIQEAGVEPVPLDDLLARSDFVSLHARATADNVRLMDRTRFGHMKAGAAFINTARETLVDEAALEWALHTGRLSGAALDVSSPSPAQGRHRLLAFPNVVIVGHIAGATAETLLRGGEMIAGEIRRFADGQPLKNLANPAVLEMTRVPE
jgi:D-3-phosphoglycerate dehydrogenase